MISAERWPPTEPTPHIPARESACPSRQALDLGTLSGYPAAMSGSPLGPITCAVSWGPDRIDLTIADDRSLVYRSFDGRRRS